MLREQRLDILREVDKVVKEAPKLFEALGRDKWD